MYFPFVGGWGSGFLSLQFCFASPLTRDLRVANASWNVVAGLSGCHKASGLLWLSCVASVQWSGCSSWALGWEIKSSVSNQRLWGSSSSSPVSLRRDRWKCVMTGFTGTRSSLCWMMACIRSADWAVEEGETVWVIVAALVNDSWGEAKEEVVGALTSSANGVVEGAGCNGCTGPGEFGLITCEFSGCNCGIACPELTPPRLFSWMSRGSGVEGCELRENNWPDGMPEIGPEAIVGVAE